MRKDLMKIVAIFVVMIQLLSLMSVTSFANTSNENIQINKTQNVESNIINAEKIDLEKTKELKLNISAKKASISQPIKLNFDKKDVIDYYYEAEGIAVTKTNSDTTEIEFTVNDEFGHLDVYVDYGNGELVKSSVYTYKYNDTVYVDEFGKDLAFHNCMEELYNSGEITKGEWEDRYYELCQSIVKELPSQNVVSVQNDNAVATSSNSIVVSGQLSWLYPEFELYPLRYTEVELRKKLVVGSTKLDSCYTDNSGQFSFDLENVTNELDLFVRVNLSSTTLKIKPDILGSVYYFDLPIRENVSAGATVWYSNYMDFDSDFVADRALYVLQGMVVGQKFANQMGMATDEVIHVVYPKAHLYPQYQNAAYCYGITDEDIELLIECVLDCLGNHFTVEELIEAEVIINTDFTFYISEVGDVLYDDFDTLIHEYGHFVEHIKGNYRSDVLDFINPGPEHSMIKDNFVEKPGKEYAMELTWSESWATAFAHLAQDFYADEYLGVLGFADGMDSVNGVNCVEGENDLEHAKNMESPTIGPNSCEAQEYAVTALLWDLYDNSGTIESHDNISSTYQQWWNYTTKAGTYTLTDFVNVIDEYYPTIRGKVGEIMAAHQISPGNLTITNISSVENYKAAPRLTWIVNGSQSNPNNMFDVAFYDNYNNYICSTPTISNTQNYDTTYTYTVPRDVWNEAIKDYGGIFTINAVVRSYRTGEPVSGPYPSKYYPITMTNNYDIDISASNRLTQYTVKLDKGGYCDFDVTFATSGLKLIQTFGEKDTVIEIYSADGTLLKGRSDTDDKGYSLNALIDYEVEANVEYKIRVKFYSSGAYGKTRLAIMPCKGDLKNGISNLTQYEDLASFNSSGGFSLYTYLAEKGYVEAVTFTTTQSRNYRFEIFSDYDTYIYVIDPRSSDITVVNVDRNDDSGEGSNPLLIKYLEAGVPYLVVYSMYNPNSIDSTKNLVLSVDIEAS
ncbi:MAG: hypothetical protein J6A95_07510 [Clostridia bacterium]|nr:hypothetical protein [Clostridia bacterium]